MSHRLNVMLLTLVFALAAQAAQAQSIQINFSDPAQAGITPSQAVLTAAHQGGGLFAADNVFNQFTSTTDATDGSAVAIDLLGFGSDLVDTQGNATSAKLLYTEWVTEDAFVDFSNGFVSGGVNGNEDTGNPGNSGTDGNILYEGLVFTRPGEGGLAFQVSGLTPSNYDIYVYATESNAVGRAHDITFQTDSDDSSRESDGVADGISAGNNTTAFVDGLNYTVHNIDVSAGENLAIFTSITAETKDQGDFSSVGAIQIVDTAANSPCDVDGDGDCDFVEADNDMVSDFDIIRQNFFGTGLTKAEGDLSADGEVGFVDFRIWKAGFLGMGGSAEALEGISFGVPEPSTMALWLCASAIGCVGTSRWRRRR